MTAAERMQRKRDRAKAGLVRLEFWVPAAAADAVRDAVAEALRDATKPQTETALVR